MYDLIIVGGGPGGAGAGVYAARKKINTLLITEDGFGGQSLVSNDIQNWIGTSSISGFDFGKLLEKHVRAQGESLEIITGERIEKVEKMAGGSASSLQASFRLIAKSGKQFEAKTVLLTVGSHHKRLGVPGEDKFESKGVVFCSTCDAPLFKNKVVVVVGGGNSGLEAVIDLLPYASKIYLLHRTEKLKGDPVTQDKVIKNPKVTVLFNAETQEILGDAFVTGLCYKDLKTGEQKTIEVAGVFVEIGFLPNSDLVKELVDINQYGEVVVDHKTQKTSCVGIWAAGDVTDVLYKQNNISVGDAIKAVLNIDAYLHK